MGTERKIDGPSAWPARPVAVTLALLAALLAPVLASAATKRVHTGIYAPKASNTTPYSNGSVDLIVVHGGRKISAITSGLSCYTGSTPPAGVPSDDEITIRPPHSLKISASKKFSFSGPVTITPADAQSVQPIQTTFTLHGRFIKAKHGRYTAKGTDSSPVCQASTPTHFKSPFAGPA